MKNVLAAIFAVLLLAPASALAAGINYTGIVTSLDLNGPTILNGVFSVDQQISGQLIFDDTTGEISRLSVSDGTSTWGYFDGGRTVAMFETGFGNSFVAGYYQFDPVGSGPSINGHTLTTLDLSYSESKDPTFNSGRLPILTPPTLPSLANLIAMGANRPNPIALAGFVGAVDWRDVNHPGGIDGSIARLRFDVTEITAIQVVPLPAPLFLLVAGLAAIGFVGRRKAQA